MQLRLLPVVAVLVLSIALGCSGKGDQSRGQTEEGGESVQLIDKDSGKLLTNTPVNVFLDDGIRCATDPCPTKSRSWVGQTDGSGRFSPPTIPKGWSASISVDGYRGATLNGKKVIQLKARAAGPATPKNSSSSSRIKVTYVSMGRPALAIQLFNRGKAPYTVIRPRGDRLTAYEQWGGWRIAVGDGQQSFHPHPKPGPFIIATKEDWLVVPPGKVEWFEVPLEGWITMPLATGEVIDAKAREVAVKVQWLGAPAGLGKAPAPQAEPMHAQTTLKIVAASKR